MFSISLGASLVNSDVQDRAIEHVFIIMMDYGNHESLPASIFLFIHGILPHFLLNTLFLP